MSESNNDTQEKVDSLSANYKADWVRFDFTNSQSFMWTIPAYCKIGEFEFIEKNWARLLVAIIEHELSKNNPALTILYRKPLTTSKKGHPFFLNDNLDKLNNSCVQLSNNCWIDVKYSIPLIMNIIFEFCIHCGYTKEQIIIYGIGKGKSDSTNTMTNSTHKTDWIRFNFTNNKSFVYTIPAYCSLNGVELKEKNWAKLYVAIVEHELTKHNPAINDLYKINITSSQREKPFFLTNRLENLNCARLSNNRWIVVNYDIPALMNLIMKFCRHCGYKDEQIVIYGTTKGRHDADSNIDDSIDKRRIVQVLQTPRFRYGFKNDGIERKRFRELYAEINGVLCSYDDETLIRIINSVGFHYEGKIYAIPNDAKKWWIKKLEGYHTQNINIVYYESLYDICFDKCSVHNIISAEMLREYITELPLNYNVQPKFVGLCKDTTDELELLQQELLHIWGDNPSECLDELAERLPLIPFDRIKWALTHGNNFVRNGSEIYALSDSFDIDEEEIAELVQIIDDECAKTGQVALPNLPLEQYKERNPEFSESALYSIIYGYVADRYEKHGTTLSPKGAGQSADVAVRDFCIGKERCCYDELAEASRKATGDVRLSSVVDAAQSVMIRINPKDYVADNQANFESAVIDSVLDKIVVDKFLGLKEISAFGLFPSCGFAWNLYLLESYCRRFSKKYSYRCKQANSASVGAITINSCKLSYHEIMAYAVARSDIKLDKDEAFDYLQKTGYIERKRYSRIDDLLKEAKKLRQRGQ